jgi:hypothetical protein
MSCCPEWDTYDDATQERATALAGATLLMLTGYRLAGCPVTVRPCRAGCMTGVDPSWWTFPLTSQGNQSGSMLNPSINQFGKWVNMGCGCTGDCSCTTVCEVILPGYVGGIEEVIEDGVIVDPTAYRVDNGNRLVRTDGECWPLCQDMTLDVDQPGTFAVTYYNGVLVDGWGATAAGMLACEYAKACVGDPCKLPVNATWITRNGITVDLSHADPFLTGIEVVDQYVRRYNPFKLAVPSQVWSPDVRRPRITTWQA